MDPPQTMADESIPSTRKRKWSKVEAENKDSGMGQLQDEYSRKNKKKKKRKNVDDRSSDKDKMKKKKSRKSREKTFDSEKPATQVSGLVVEALSNIFEKQKKKKKKKKKRLREKGRQSALDESIPCIGNEIEARNETCAIDSIKDVQTDVEGGIMEIHTPLKESSTMFDKQKKKKNKKRSKEKVTEAAFDNSVRCTGKEMKARDETGMVDLVKDIQADTDGGIMEYHTPLKDSSVSSTTSSNSTHRKRRKFKLASTSDLNLLISNPDLDSIKVSQAMEEPMGEYILPDPCVSSLAVYSNSNIPLSCSFSQEECGVELEPNISDVVEQEQEQIEDAAAATSASWHVPVTPRNRLQIKSIARAAVSEVMTETSGHDSLLGASCGLKSRQRRTLSKYELLCRTSPSDGHIIVNDDAKAVEYFEKDDSNSTNPPDLKMDSKGTLNESADNSVPCDPLAKKIVTIKDLYRTPKRKKVPAVLYEACKFIFAQNIEVSALNIAYTGHCVPGDQEYRRLLRKVYKAKFGRYHDEQDSMLLKRFDTLVQHGVVEDKVEFCNFLNTYCNGKDQTELMRSKRSIGVRNIVGLYVGQDMPRKIAAVHCLRLIKLVLGSSYLFPSQDTAISSGVNNPQVEEAEDDIPEDVRGGNIVSNRDVTPVKKRVVRNWSKEEDMYLIKEVIRGSDTRVECIDPMMVDWEGVAQSLDRKPRNVAEHWSRVVQPILVEDTDPASIISYRRKLLEEVIKMEAGHRKEIDWDSLAKIFHPRSTYAIQMNFYDLVRGGRVSSATDSPQEFQERVGEALAKVNRLASLPKEKMGKFFKRMSYKEELREYYWDLVN